MVSVGIGPTAGYYDDYYSRWRYSSLPVSISPWDGYWLEDYCYDDGYWYWHGWGSPYYDDYWGPSPYWW